MKQLRGDWDKLEGKVILYSIFEPDKQNMPERIRDEFPDKSVIALYACDDIVEFKQKMKDKLDVDGDEVEKGLQQDPLAELFKNVKGMNVRTNALYVSPMFVENEYELMDGSEDLFFMGTFDSPVIAIKANMLGLELYRFYLEDKANRESDKKEENAKISPSYSGNVRLYTEFRNKNITDYVRSTFIDPLIDAASKGDRQMLNTIKRDFNRFADGSQYVKRVSQLCDRIEKDSKKQNMTVISAFVDEINAIHNENYEYAAKKRDEIKKLLS